MTESQDKWYQLNKERILKQRKEEYNKDPEYFKSKSLTAYYANHDKHLEDKKKIRNRDKEKLKIAAKLRWQNMTLEEKMLRRIKERVRKSSLPFNLELSDIIIPSHCPIFGIPLYTSKKVGPNTPSVDRVKNELGYVKGNIKVISMKANSMKGAMSIDECEKLLNYMKKSK